MEKTIEPNSTNAMQEEPIVTAGLNDTITGNSTTGIRDEDLAKVEITVLALILFVAIVGNSLMLLALRKQLKFRPMSRIYFFMLNLSIADLLVAFCNILPQLAWDITFRFKGPDLLCRAVKFLQVFVLYLSTYILTSMTVDRYLVVCHPSFTRNYYSGHRGPKLLVLASYVLSFLCASPQAIIFKMHRFDSGDWDCWVNFDPPWLAKVYVTYFVLTAFVLPLIIITFSYGAICVKVIGFRLPKEDKRHKKFSNPASSSEHRIELESASLDEPPLKRAVSSGTQQALQKHVSQAKIKTLKLTLVVVICFFVCWAPFCFTQLITTYVPTEANSPFSVIFLLLASLNSCTNPWIYLAFSESLFNQLRVCLGMGIGRASNEESIGDEQDSPKKKKPQMEQIEIAKAQQPLIRGQSSIPRDPRDKEAVQPDTKSDML